jgi:hypothetical protein
MVFLRVLMDGNDGDVGAQQPIVAIAVGRRLDGEFQRIGDLQRRHRRQRRRPMQEVHHVCARGHLLIERDAAGLADGLQAV